MTITMVTVSEKGQIAIPNSIRSKIGIKKGDKLLLVQIDDKIILEKSKHIEDKMKDSMKDILSLSEKSLKEVWDNEEDEIWSQYLK